MAAQKKSKSERRRPPEPGSLEAAILSSLARLVEYEGSIAAVARSFALQRQRLSSWLSRGIPASESREGLVQLASALYARLAQLDKNQPTRDARDRKIAQNRAARELLATFADRRERRRLVDSLRGWVRRYDEVARFRRQKQRGVAAFALELGVPRALVSRAVAPGRESFSVKLFALFRQFERRQAEQAVEDEIHRGQMLELMELAKDPGTYTRKEKRVRTRWVNGEKVKKTVWVDVEHDEHVLPRVPDGDWEFGARATYGRRWGSRIGRFLIPRLHPSGDDGWAVVERFANFARSVPGMMPAARFPEWCVYLIASQIGDETVGSNPQYRDLDHEASRRFVVSEVFSSGNRRGAGARERAIDVMIEKIGVALDGPTLIYLHGGIAWNYRKRTEEEVERREKRYREDREFAQTLREIEARVEKAAAERRKKRARRAKRKKVLAGVMSRRAERKKRT